MVEVMNNVADLDGDDITERRNHHRLSDPDNSPPPPRDSDRPGDPQAPSSSPPLPRGRERHSREWPIGPGGHSSSPPPPPRSRSRGRERDSREREFDRPNGRGGRSSSPLPPRRGRERDSRERDFERREFYDRNRYPPPPREYKRNRPSFSPPPPPYRERRGGGGRYSPPRRRSPPFADYKRRRRDNGGFGGHNGDRRFYNDYPDAYDRDMGSRPGCPDERHGRNMDRSSGGYQPSFDSGRGGRADAFNTGRTRREGLMSYKQFMQELEDDVLPSEAEHRYQEYRSEYISTQKKAHFEAHKDEEWLKDKYHPTNLVAVIERRNEFARKQAKGFQHNLLGGALDIGPSVMASSSNKSGQSNDLGSDGEEGGKRNRHGKGSAKEEDLLSAAPKAHPVSSEFRRIQIDIQQAQALVQKLDFEKGIKDNILCRNDNEKAERDKSHGVSSDPVIIIRGLTSVKGLEGNELLDTLLTYLWRIHGLDYYGLTETNGAKGLRHVRVDGKTSDVMVNGAEWEKKLDSRWKDRLKGQDPLEIMAATEKIDAAANEGLDPYVRKIRDEKYGWKYGCGAKGCTKLFHAAEFVHKHLKLKHQELMVELTSKVRADLYFQNYMNDENAPGGTPVMQQLTVKDRLQKHRLGPDSRLKDERSLREHDYRSNGSEGFDGSEDDNADEAMFDAYRGQGIPMAPFPSDMPPPVLMPVPGAGPLGPFVPAPPEVAMRMLREQGGPSPFEGGGRNGMSGPQLGGPSPIIALPPAFREDPRRLRSYQDLDAPEDEVTVIDYRSL